MSHYGVGQARDKRGTADFGFGVFDFGLDCQSIRNPKSKIGPIL
jgi:hypothetical protein